MSKRFLPIALIVAAAVLAVLGLAWLDGGREDMREIAVPVDMAEIGR